jgi:hypothetical protein
MGRYSGRKVGLSDGKSWRVWKMYTKYKQPDPADKKPV